MKAVIEINFPHVRIQDVYPVIYDKMAKTHGYSHHTATVAATEVCKHLGTLCGAVVIDQPYTDAEIKAKTQEMAIAGFAKRETQRLLNETLRALDLAEAYRLAG